MMIWLEQVKLQLDLFWLFESLIGTLGHSASRIDKEGDGSNKPSQKPPSGLTEEASHCPWWSSEDQANLLAIFGFARGRN